MSNERKVVAATLTYAASVLIGALICAKASHGWAPEYQFIGLAVFLFAGGFGLGSLLLWMWELDPTE